MKNKMIEELPLEDVLAKVIKKVKELGTSNKAIYDKNRGELPSWGTIERHTGMTWGQLMKMFKVSSFKKANIRTRHEMIDKYCELRFRLNRHPTMIEFMSEYRVGVTTIYNHLTNYNIMRVYFEEMYQDHPSEKNSRKMRTDQKEMLQKELGIKIR